MANKKSKGHARERIDWNSVGAADFTELSQVGVRSALELAKIVKAEVTVDHVVGQGELMQYHTELTEGTPEQQLRPLLHPVDTYQQALSRFIKTHFADLTADVKVHEEVEMGIAGGCLLSFMGT